MADPLWRLLLDPCSAYPGLQGLASYAGLLAIYFFTAHQYKLLASSNNLEKIHI